MVELADGVPQLFIDCVFNLDGLDGRRMLNITND